PGARRPPAGDGRPLRRDARTARRVLPGGGAGPGRGPRHRGADSGSEGGDGRGAAGGGAGGNAGVGEVVATGLRRTTKGWPLQDHVPATGPIAAPWICR